MEVGAQRSGDSVRDLFRRTILPSPELHEMSFPVSSKAHGTAVNRVCITPALHPAHVPLTLRAPSLLDYPDDAVSGAVEDEVVDATIAGVIKGEDAIVRGFSVVASNAGARISVGINSREQATGLLDHRDDTCSGAIQHKVVRF